MITDDDVNIPDDYLCPISQEILTDPVMAADGQTYQREYIAEWLSRGNLTSPLDGSNLSDLLLKENLFARKIIKEFLNRLSDKRQQKSITCDCPKSIQKSDVMNTVKLEKIDQLNKLKINNWIDITFDVNKENDSYNLKFNSAINLNKQTSIKQFLNTKMKLPHIKNSIEYYITKKFAIHEIILEGLQINFLLYKNLVIPSINETTNIKKINNLLDQELSNYYILIIEPFYENNFKLLNSKLNLREVSPTYLNETKNSQNIVKNNSNNKNLLISKMNSIINSHLYKKIFTRLVQKNFETFSEINILDPFVVFEQSINKFKTSFTTMQDDYIQNSNNLLNKDLLNETYKKINDINQLYDILNKSISDYYEYLRKSNNNKINDFKYQENFDCRICLRKFETPQALGGHMSRRHPNCSEKYKIKSSIRKNRTKQRALLQEAKIKVFLSKGYDYLQLKSSQEKNLIRRILYHNNKEFKAILKQIKTEK